MPNDDSDEDGWEENCTVRNPKGKLKFLYGPWDPKARKRYINSGDLDVKLIKIISLQIARTRSLHWRECSEVQRDGCQSQAGSRQMQCRGGYLRREAARCPQQNLRVGHRQKRLWSSF